MVMVLRLLLGVSAMWVTLRVLEEEGGGLGESVVGVVPAAAAAFFFFFFFLPPPFFFFPLLEEEEEALKGQHPLRVGLSVVSSVESRWAGMDGTELKR